LPSTQSITDFFTPTSRSPDGGVQMLEQCPVSRKRLYLVNQHGRKLLQLMVKDEHTHVAAVRHAQIKLIPYGTHRARVYQSEPGWNFAFRRGIAACVSTSCCQPKKSGTNGHATK